MSDKRKHNEILAIAYLTGQASPEQVAEYRQAYANNDAFRQVVRDIEVWLAPLADETVNKAPPPDLFDKIILDIEDKGFAETTVSDILPTANDNQAGKWKMMALAASAVAVLSIGLHFIPAEQETPITDQEQMVALLSGADKPPLVAIIYNPLTHEIVAKLSNVSVPSDADLQLWLIREGAPAPVSLGVMEKSSDGESVSFSVPASLQNGTDVLAVSLEKIGGSRSAGPEGPVLYTGAIGTI